MSGKGNELPGIVSTTGTWERKKSFEVGSVSKKGQKEFKACHREEPVWSKVNGQLSWKEKEMDLESIEVGED